MLKTGAFRPRKGENLKKYKEKIKFLCAKIISKFYKIFTEILERRQKQYSRGQCVYNIKSGRIGIVEFFDNDIRLMRLRLRKNIVCEYNSREINKFRPYFGRLDPNNEGGFEDGYVDTIYKTKNECDKITFDIKEEK